jgi:hypothetical protein
MVRKIIWILIGVFVFASPAAARGPSTPEERARLVRIAHELELAPLDESLRPDRTWVIDFLADVPDIALNMCLGALGDFSKSSYPYANAITFQLIPSMAAFMVEHPESANDAARVQLAGVEGALKAYDSILKAQPGAKSPSLDDLLQKQSAGTLADTVRESTKTCK